MQRHTARADGYEAEILPLLKHEDTGWAGWVNQKREAGGKRTEGFGCSIHYDTA